MTPWLLDHGQGDKMGEQPKGYVVGVNGSYYMVSEVCGSEQPLLDRAMREFIQSKVPFHPLPELPSGLLITSISDVEIGAGQGLHAISYCNKNPTRRLLAIERTKARFAKLARRHMHHPQLTNLIPLHADAVSVITHHIPDLSLERVFLLYPNPYPKFKQRNLRWYNSPFLSCLKEKMRHGASLYLATNLEWYAIEAKERLCMDWGFHLQVEREIGAHYHPRTHFEKKYLQRGERCFDLEFIKT